MKLRKLFDYQRFEGNTRLAEMIGEAEETDRRPGRLSDDLLGMVSAAGEVNEEMLAKYSKKR